MVEEVGVMKQRQILWAIVFGSVLAITGCGDDENGGGGGSNGSAGSNGTAGSGGAAGSAGTGGSTGSATSSCEAFCGGDCIFGVVVPGGSYDACVDACRTQEPDWNDNCGAAAIAYLDCLEANACNFAAAQCFPLAEDWDDCM
jgi:hypothetical protein